MRKSLGDKRREMDESHIAKVLETYHAYEDNTDVSKVYPNSYFGYRKVTVDRPLKLNVQTSVERMDRLGNEKQFTKLDESEQIAYSNMLEALPSKLYMSRDEFVKDLNAEAKSRGLKVHHSREHSQCTWRARCTPKCAKIAKENQKRIQT